MGAIIALVLRTRLPPPAAMSCHHQIIFLLVGPKDNQPLNGNSVRTGRCNDAGNDDSHDDDDGKIRTHTNTQFRCKCVSVCWENVCLLFALQYGSQFRRMSTSMYGCVCMYTG